MPNYTGDTSDAVAVADEARTGRYITVQEIATLYGCSVSTVEVWKQAGMPATRKGSKGVAAKFDSAQVIQWLIRRAVERATRELRPSGNDPENGGAQGLGDPKFQLLNIKAQEAALNLRLRQGRLVGIETVETVLANHISIARGVLLSLSASVSQQCATSSDPNEIARLIDDSVHDILDELASIEISALLSEDAQELAKSTDETEVTE